MATDAHTLDRADALRLLRDSHSARIGFSVDGEPFVVPATVIVEADGRIDVYIDDAHALRHLDGRRVAVEVDGRAPRPGDGWYVVARGVAKSVSATAVRRGPVSDVRAPPRSPCRRQLVRRRAGVVTGGRRDADGERSGAGDVRAGRAPGTGRAVRIRPARPSDISALRDFYDELSDTSTYYRFFGLRRFIPAEELAAATVQAVRAHVTLVAEAGDHLIGLGEYHAVPGGEEAEVAFAVADLHQHEGIGTVLLEDLAIDRPLGRIPPARRLDDAGELADATRASAPSAWSTREWFADGVVHVELDLTTAHLMEDDADLRDWRSAVESLRPILQPSHVVVIGASSHGSGPGRRILDHLRTSFAGRISVVHPSAATIGGVASRRSDQ